MNERDVEKLIGRLTLAPPRANFGRDVLIRARSTAAAVRRKGAVRRRLIATSIAAAVLLAGGVFWVLFAGAGNERYVAPAGASLKVQLVGGTRLELAPGSRACELDPEEASVASLRLEQGEIRVAAVKAPTGKRALRVETPEGFSVETLGTRFTARRCLLDEKGEPVMTENRAAAVALSVVLLVSVSEGRVRLANGFCSETVAAGETGVAAAGKVAAGAKDQRRIRCRVAALLQGGRIRFSVGSADGVKVGFEFDVSRGGAKIAAAKVVSVEARTCVAEIRNTTGEVRVGDVAATRFRVVDPARRDTQNRKADWGKESDGLRVGLRAKKIEFPIAEPMEFELAVKNVSSKAVTIPDGGFGPNWRLRFGHWAWRRVKPVPIGFTRKKQDFVLRPGEVRLIRLVAGDPESKLHQGFYRGFQFVWTGPCDKPILPRDALPEGVHDVAASLGKLRTGTCRIRVGTAISWRKESDGLLVGLRAKKTEFSIGEAMEFEVVCRNVSGKKLHSSVPALHGADWSLQLGTWKWAYGGPPRPARRVGPPQPKPLNPGQTSAVSTWAGDPRQPGCEGYKFLWAGPAGGTFAPRAALPEGIYEVRATWGKHATGTVRVWIRPAGGPVVKGLRLTLSADKTELTSRRVPPPAGGRDHARPGEGFSTDSAKFKLTFSNVGEKAIKLDAYDLLWKRVEFKVTGPDRNSVAVLRKMVDRAMAAPEERHYPNLKPGASYVPALNPSLPGSIGARNYRFLKPGEYRVSASYINRVDPRAKTKLQPFQKGCWSGTVASNEVVLKVLAPGAGPAPAPVRGLRLRISFAAGNSVESGKQLKMISRLENVGKVPVSVWSRSCSWGHSRISVVFRNIATGREFKKTETQRKWRKNVPALKTLAPGKAQVVTFDDAKFETGGGMLPPGTYRVKATYANDDDGGKFNWLKGRAWTGRVNSNDLQLKLLPAGGAKAELERRRRRLELERMRRRPPVPEKF